MEYISRMVDDVIDRKTEAFNAVSITGPKGCGKTRTARERCKTVIEFQDEDKREGYLASQYCLTSGRMPQRYGEQ